MAHISIFQNDMEWFETKTFEEKSFGVLEFVNSDIAIFFSNTKDINNMVKHLNKLKRQMQKLEVVK